MVPWSVIVPSPDDVRRRVVGVERSLGAWSGEAGRAALGAPSGVDRSRDGTGVGGRADDVAVESSLRRGSTLVGPRKSRDRLGNGPCTAKGKGLVAISEKGRLRTKLAEPLFANQNHAQMHFDPVHLGIAAGTWGEEETNQHLCGQQFSTRPRSRRSRYARQER